MPELKLTALQQRFFLAIVEGKPPTVAIKEARGPRAKAIKDDTARQHGVKMMKDPGIIAALARARDAALERSLLRVEDLVQQLMDTRQVAFACDPPQLSAAVAATMGAAKLLGLAIDRSEVNIIHSKPSLLPTTQLELSVEEWRRQFDPDPTKARVISGDRSGDERVRKD